MPTDKPKGKKPLKLMPLDQFGKLVETIARVPKDAVDKIEADRPKRVRRGSRPA